MSRWNAGPDSRWPGAVALWISVAFILLVAPAGAGPVKVISQSEPGGITLDQPGANYILAADLNCVAGDLKAVTEMLGGGPVAFNTAVHIEANYVTLWMNGHSIAGVFDPGNTTGILVKGNARGVQIIGGGPVTGFDWGIIFADGAQWNRIVQVRANDNLNFGIHFGSDNSNNSLIANQANHNDVGIEFFADNRNNSLTGNQANWNRVGITLNQNNRNNLVAYNQANGNTVAGIWPFGTGNVGNKIQFNRAYNNAFGIRVGASSNGNTFWFNKALGNITDLVDDNVPAALNTWRFNQFETDNESPPNDGPGAGVIK